MSMQLPGPGLEQWEWQLIGACRGMDSGIFFHPPGERGGARTRRANQAKAICQDCPVIGECLEHALRMREPYGVWGGRTEEERAKILGVQSLRYPAPARDPCQKATSSERQRSERGSPSTHAHTSAAPGRSTTDPENLEPRPAPEKGMS